MNIWWRIALEYYRGDFGLKQFREFIKTESGSIRWVGTLLKRCDFGIEILRGRIKGWNMNSLWNKGTSAARIGGNLNVVMRNRLLIKYVTNKWRHCVIWKYNELSFKEVKPDLSYTCNTSGCVFFLYTNMKIEEVKGYLNA